MIESLHLTLGVVGAAAVVGTILAMRRSPPALQGSDRRRAPRIEPPRDCAVLSIEGSPFPLKNWSVSGFLAEAYDGPLSIGQRSFVNFHVRQNPFDIAFAAEVEVVRRGAGELAGRFVFLPPDNKGQIEAYFAYFGQMR